MFDKDQIPTTNLTRDWSLTDIRADDKDGKPFISGHAAVFDTLSVNLGTKNYPWYEKIRSGAFSKTLREADVRALWQHDVNFVLGRNKNKTLTLWENNRGLAFEAYPPDTALVRDLVMAPIKRGDVDQVSFMFDAVLVNWIEEESQPPVRELVEVRLYEISPVTFPAYPATDVSARAALGALGIQIDPLSQAILRANGGKLAETDRAMVEAAIGNLSALLPDGPLQEGHPNDEQAGQRAQARRLWLRREIELLAVEENI